MAHEAKLIDRERLAGGVAVFRFEKPEGFQFIAGQWSLLTVPAAGFKDDRGLGRPLSIARDGWDCLFIIILSADHPCKVAPGPHHGK